MSARDKRPPTKDSVSLLPCFYFVELPILVSFVVSLYFLEWTDLFKPAKSGFTCHDRSLSLPYIEPTHEVIPLLMLLSLAFAGPAITIMIGEAILFCCVSRRRGAVSEANINAAGCNFNSFIRRAVRFVGVHAFGLCATALITDILQLMTGYPAPYFLTVCRPNYTSLNVSCEHNSYVMEDICAGPDPAAITQGRKSFPSQHATLASFAAVYVSMYFNSTLTDSSKLLKPLLVFSFIISAIICGLTRIIQYKNHAVDVYLGFLLGGAIAVYLGVFAVGNFQPSEECSSPSAPQPQRPTCSLPHISQEAVLHHMQMKAMAGEALLPTSHSEGLLHRGLAPPQRPEDALKAHAEGEALSPRSPQSKEAYMAFSHTLPRVHTPQAIAAYEEAARRHAATLHHASMDSSRSKQLLSQWKNKNHKCSLQVPDSFSSSLDSSSGQSSQHAPHHGSMDHLHPGSDSASVGLNGGFDCHSYMAKLAAGSSTTLPSNCSGITGGARMAMQSRPGSSQLVHIPEEAHEHYSSSPRAAPSANEAAAAGQANWQKAAEKTVRAGEQQPRIMQVIAMSKQQGLLQTHSKSLDESSIGAPTAGCPGPPGPPRYRALTEQDSSSMSGSTGAIVRVEAHPENKPVIQPPSTDGSGSWRWRSLDHGTGTRGGASLEPGGGPALRQSFEMNDLNRDSESCEGSMERKRANHVVTTSASVTVHTQAPPGQSEPRAHPTGLSTIRVTPGEAGPTAAESASETPSVASSRESTLRRKNHNVILIPERANSPDSTRHIFYKGTSITPAFKE